MEATDSCAFTRYGSDGLVCLRLTRCTRVLRLSVEVPTRAHPAPLRLTGYTKGSESAVYGLYMGWAPSTRDPGKDSDCPSGGGVL